MDPHGLYTMFAGQLYAVWQKMENDQKLIVGIFMAKVTLSLLPTSVVYDSKDISVFL